MPRRVRLLLLAWPDTHRRLDAAHDAVRLIHDDAHVGLLMEQLGTADARFPHQVLLVEGAAKEAWLFDVFDIRVAKAVALARMPVPLVTRASGVVARWRGRELR